MIIIIIIIIIFIEEINFSLQFIQKDLIKCIGSSYRCSRKEKRWPYDFCDRQEDLQRSSWFVQSDESERQNIRAAISD